MKKISTIFLATAMLCCALLSGCTNLNNDPDFPTPVKVEIAPASINCTSEAQTVEFEVTNSSLLNQETVWIKAVHFENNGKNYKIVTTDTQDSESGLIGNYEHVKYLWFDVVKKAGEAGTNSFSVTLDANIDPLPRKLTVDLSNGLDEGSIVITQSGK